MDEEMTNRYRNLITMKQAYYGTLSQIFSLCERLATIERDILNISESIEAYERELAEQALLKKKR